MSIFDFIPSHLCPEPTNNSSTTMNATNANTLHTTQNAPLDRTETLDHATLELELEVSKEWEQTCYTAWVEMEQDICGFAA